MFAFNISSSSLSFCHSVWSTCYCRTTIVVKRAVAATTCPSQALPSVHNPRVDVPAAARVSTFTPGATGALPVEQQRAVGARCDQGQILELAAFCFSLLLL